MTKSQPLGNFLTLVQGGLLVLGLAGCSGDAESVGSASGSGGTTGGSAGSAAGGNSGGAASGGSAGSAGSGGAGGGGTGNGGSGSSSGGGNSGGTGATADPLIGVFKVDVVADEEDPTKGRTAILGTVSSGATPPTAAWKVIKEEGGCKLEKPSQPFCETPCIGGACIADGVCQSYPELKLVGDVTVTGVRLPDGGSSVKLKEISKTYQQPAEVTFAYPPFAAGDAVKLTASGGDFPGFEISSKGIQAIKVTSKDVAMDVGKPLNLAWVAAADPKASNIYVKVDISHHGGIKGMIECNVDDSGSLSVGAALVTELIGYGVAGFPTVSVIRSSTGTAKVGSGHVNLLVSSSAEAALIVAGTISCNEDEDCGAGKTCQNDLTCK